MLRRSQDGASSLILRSDNGAAALLGRAKENSLQPMFLPSLLGCPAIVVDR
jgi:hypothetical protein